MLSMMPDLSLVCIFSPAFAVVSIVEVIRSSSTLDLPSRPAPRAACRRCFRSAPPQSARALPPTQPAGRAALGDSELLKMTIGSVAIACRGSVVTTVLTKIDQVKSSGAVSPAARAIATMVAVTIPPTAVGRITVSTVRVREAPSAMLPSRSVDGTSSSTSSVARAIKGSMMIARPSAAGEAALAAADHDQAEDEHADHDGGHAGQHVQREPDRFGQPLRRELGVEDRKQHADRQRDRRRRSGR